jgi:hypothetical protein
MTVRGGCLCGGVRYELSAPFRRANFCHCSRCRKHTGAAASAQGRVPREGFTLLQGAELVETFRPEGGMAKAFCRVCGSSLFGGTWPDGPEVSIRLGTLDDDPGIRPQYHSFAADVPPWDRLPDDGLPRYQSPPTPPPRTSAASESAT